MRWKQYVGVTVGIPLLCLAVLLGLALGAIYSWAAVADIGEEEALMGEKLRNFRAKYEWFNTECGRPKLSEPLYAKLTSKTPVESSLSRKLNKKKSTKKKEKGEHEGRAFSVHATMEPRKLMSLKRIIQFVVDSA